MLWVDCPLAPTKLHTPDLTSTTKQDISKDMAVDTGCTNSSQTAFMEPPSWPLGVSCSPGIFPYLIQVSRSWWWCMALR